MHYKKAEIIKAVLDFIRGENFSNIKANIKGYQPPQKLIWKNSNTGYFPDITAVKDGMFLLFTIKDSEESLKNQIDKWRLFSFYSNVKNRECYIVGMANQEFTIKNLLFENKIRAKVLTVGH